MFIKSIQYTTIIVQFEQHCNTLVSGITCIQPETWANMILSSVDTNYNGRVNTTCEEGFVFNMTGVQLSERPSYWESTCSGDAQWDPPLLGCIGEKSTEMIMAQSSFLNAVRFIFLQHLATLEILKLRIW